VYNTGMDGMLNRISTIQAIQRGRESLMVKTPDPLEFTLEFTRAMSCVESFGRIAVPDGGAGCFFVDWLGKIRIKLE
jgi:hypothetical protein